jgi:hypothetical protein
MKRTIKQAIKSEGLNVENFSITSDGQFESKLTNVRKANAEAKKVVKALRTSGHRVDGYLAGYGIWVYNVNMGAQALYMRELISNNAD